MELSTSQLQVVFVQVLWSLKRLQGSARESNDRGGLHVPQVVPMRMFYTVEHL